MSLSTLIRFFLLGLCLGEKRETVSSISFHRRSLKNYFTENPRIHKEQIDYFRHRPNILKSIQYAPLNPEDEMYTDHDDNYNPTSRHQFIESKVHLEPRYIENAYNDGEVTQANFLHYIKGHNIVVPLKSVDYGHKDNEYGHDVRSERNKEMDQIEFRRDIVSLKAVTKADAHIDIKNQQTLPKNEYPTKSYQVLSALENSKIEPVFNSYVKVPRLHLNIARAYNFARMPPKASVIGYQKLLSNNPKHAFVPNIDVLLQEKTFLYPVDNNKYTLRT